MLSGGSHGLLAYILDEGPLFPEIGVGRDLPRLPQLPLPAAVSAADVVEELCNQNDDQLLERR